MIVGEHVVIWYKFLWGTLPEISWNKIFTFNSEVLPRFTGKYLQFQAYFLLWWKLQFLVRNNLVSQGIKSEKVEKKGWGSQKRWVCSVLSR